MTESSEPSYDEWIDAAAEEYRRLDDLLGDLHADDWVAPTDCAEWDVRAMVAHLVGAAEANAAVHELLRQAVKGMRVRRHGDLVDKMNAVQVLERAGRDGPTLRADLREVGTRGLAGRRRLPALLLSVPVPFGPPLGVRRVGYLMGRIYTRDAWLHRIDISRATGRAPVLTAEHDGRIVDDVVREWADTHRAAYRLELTGAAGGCWTEGQPTDTLRLDAIEFCRAVSGRAPADGLLATPVPF